MTTPYPIIWKFPLEVRPGTHLIHAPDIVKVLTVQVQAGVPVLWLLVDPDTPATQKEVEAVMTGERADASLHYAGTTQHHEGAFILHWFTDPPHIE